MSAIEEIIQLKEEHEGCGLKLNTLRQQVRQQTEEIKALRKQLEFYKNADQRAKTFDAWDEKWCSLNNVRIEFKRKPDKSLVTIRPSGRPAVTEGNLKRAIDEARGRFKKAK